MVHVGIAHAGPQSNQLTEAAKIVPQSLLSCPAFNAGMSMAAWSTAIANNYPADTMCPGIPQYNFVPRGAVAVPQLVTWEKAMQLSAHGQQCVHNVSRNSARSSPVVEKHLPMPDRFEPLIIANCMMLDWSASASPVALYYLNGHAPDARSQECKADILRLINNQSMRKCFLCGGLGHHALEKMHKALVHENSNVYRCPLLHQQNIEINNTAAKAARNANGGRPKQMKANPDIPQISTNGLKMLTKIITKIEYASKKLLRIEQGQAGQGPRLREMIVDLEEKLRIRADAIQGFPRA